MFKDYGFDDIFKDDENGNRDLTIQSYFKGNGEPNEEKIEVFLKNLQFDVASAVEDASEDIQTETSDLNI